MNGNLAAPASPLFVEFPRGPGRSALIPVFGPVPGTGLVVGEGRDTGDELSTLSHPQLVEQHPGGEYPHEDQLVPDGGGKGETCGGGEEDPGYQVPPSRRQLGEKRREQMTSVEGADGEPVEEPPDDVHVHEQAGDETSQSGEGAGDHGDQPHRGGEEEAGGRTGGGYQGPLARGQLGVGDPPFGDTAQPVELDFDLGPEATSGQGVAQLVDQDREEDDRHPRHHQVDAGETAEPPKGEGDQEERRVDGDRYSEQRERDQDSHDAPSRAATHRPRGYPRRMHDDLRAAVAADMPRLKELLFDLVRMESVSAHGHDPVKVREAGERIVAILEDAGYENARLLESGIGHPAVFAEMPAPEGAPTILLYAHYDVQPTGPIGEWVTGPFEPFEKDGRIYGRGVSDDKSGIVMHLGAVAAHGDYLPVGVQIFLEGEEESGSGGLGEILDRHSDLIHPDVIVIGDGGNWEVGVPGILSRLRGVVGVKLELRTLGSAVHSGQFGGVVPDALMALSRLLATLHNDDGSVAVEGLVDHELDDSQPVPEELIREVTGAVGGLIGKGSIPSRLWSRPSISVLAIDAPPVAEAINQLVPVARAKVSMRIAPGQDATAALEALKDHLRANVPWGASVDFTYQETGDATTLDIDNYAVEAWKEAFTEAYGTETIEMGAGGSIPFIATFHELYPEAPILVVGCGDPTSAIHAPNESQDVGDIEKATLAEAIAFRLLSQ
jgi:cysteinylglycine-S-conjugate dipeptidase